MEYTRKNPPWRIAEQLPVKQGLWPSSADAGKYGYKIAEQLPVKQGLWP